MADWGLGIKHLATAGNTVPTKYWTDTGKVDEEGNPILENEWVEMKSLKPSTPNREYTADENGEWVDTTPTEVLMAEMQKSATDACEAYIQSVIDTYNTTHGISLGHVHTCANYAQVEDYTHQAFCKDVWLWSVDVWEEARIIQSKVFGGEIAPPSVEEFIAMLPAYKGTV